MSRFNNHVFMGAIMALVNLPNMVTPGSHFSVYAQALQKDDFFRPKSQKKRRRENNQKNNRHKKSMGVSYQGQNAMSVSYQRRKR